MGSHRPIVFWAIVFSDRGAVKYKAFWFEESKRRRRLSHIAWNCDTFAPGLFVRINDDEDYPSTLKTQEGACFFSLVLVF